MSKCNGSGGHGNFSYHLKQLSEFLEFDPSTKKYLLNYRGRVLSEIICEFGRLIDEVNQPFEYVAKLKNGDHAFSLYKSESFRHDIVLEFFKSGLLKGNALVSIVDEKNYDREVLTYKNHRIGFDNLSKGALTVIPSYEWYIQKGEGKAKTLTANWKRLVKEKKEAGFSGVQVAVETETFFDNGKIEELLRYEKSLGRQLSVDCTAICLYDKKRFKDLQISSFLKAHSQLISEEFCGKLPFFEYDKEFIS